MKEKRGQGEYFYRNSIVLGWGGDCRIQLELLILGRFYPN